MGWVVPLLNAIAAIPKIGEQLEKLVAKIVAWQMQRLTDAALSAIQDAAALQRRAKTKEDRYAVAQKWVDALSKPRAAG